MSVIYHRELKRADETLKTEDWAEYEGCAELEMQEIYQIINGGDRSFELLQSVVKRLHIVRKRTGEIIDALTPESALLLRPQVFDWLRQNVREAARDEQLDPEA